MKNMFSALQDIGKIQSKMEDMRQQMNALEVVGKSGGGMVEIVMKGDGNIANITISPDIFKENELEMLQDLLIAAFNHAREALDDARNTQTKEALSGLPLPKDFKLPF